jgi:hypothetical protein
LTTNSNLVTHMTGRSPTSPAPATSVAISLQLTRLRSCDIGRRSRQGPA